MTDTTITLIALTAILCCVVFIVRLKRRSPLTHLPGPKPTSYLFNLYNPPADPEKSDRWLNSTYMEYGPVVRLPCGIGPDLLLLSSGAVFKELMLKYKHLIGDRDDRAPERLLFGGKFSMFGDWKPFRQVIFNGLLRHRTLCQEKLEHSVENAVHVLAEHKDSTVLYPAILDRCVCSFLINAATGTAYEVNDPLVTSLTDTVTELIQYIEKAQLVRVAPFVKYLPFGMAIASAMQRYRKRVSEPFMLQLNTFPGLPVEDEKLNFLQYVKKLQMKEIAENGKISSFDDEAISAVLGGVVFAGLNLTTTAILRLLLLLIKYPEWQDKIQKEIDNLGPESLKVADHSYCPTAQAFVSEMLRIDMPVCGSMPTILSGDSVLGGYHIPAGTSFIFNTRSVREDPNLFEDPLTFNPGRYLSSEGKFIKQLNTFYVFSIGPRNCIGKTLAITTMLHVLLGILQRFTVQNGEDFMPPELIDVKGAVQHKLVFERRGVEQCTAA